MEVITQQLQHKSGNKQKVALFLQHVDKTTACFRLYFDEKSLIKFDKQYSIYRF